VSATALYALRVAARMWSTQPVYREYTEEIRGLADHAGVPYGELLALNLSYDLSACGFTFPGLFGCTGAVHNALGGPVLLRNLDWTFPPKVRSSSAVFILHTQNQDVLSYGFPGLVGVISGMNSSGVCVTLNQAFVTQLPNNSWPVPWRIRNTLTTCTDVAAAEESLTHVAASSALYLVADKERCGLIESTGSEYETHWAPPRTSMVCANHYTDDHADPDTRVWGDSFARKEALSRALARGDTPKQALRRSPVLHADTVQQLVFEPTLRRAHARFSSTKSPTWRTHCL